MPELPLTGDNAADWHTVMAIIPYGYRTATQAQEHAAERERAEYIAAAVVNDALTRAELAAHNQVTLPLPILRTLATTPIAATTSVPSPLLDVVLARWDQGYARGVNAGHVLRVLYQLIELGEGKASVNKAALLVACLRAPEPIDPKNLPRDRGIRDTWTKYKPVAHLYAAYEHPQAREKLLAKQDVRRFLAVAEYFRNVATSYIPHGHREPLIRANNTWTVPDGYELPHLELTFTPDKTTAKLTALLPAVRKNVAKRRD